ERRPRKRCINYFQPRKGSQRIQKTAASLFVQNRFQEKVVTSIYYHVVSSPVGDLTLVSNGEALTGVYMSYPKRGPDLDPTWQRDEAEFDAVAQQLAAYFAGDLREFDVPLAPRGTEFQNKVWRELCRIPYGETISYGELARRIGQPGASRAVGLANGRN